MDRPAQLPDKTAHLMATFLHSSRMHQYRQALPGVTIATISAFDMIKQ